MERDARRQRNPTAYTPFEGNYSPVVVVSVEEECNLVTSSSVFASEVTVPLVGTVIVGSGCMRRRSDTKGQQPADQHYYSSLV